MELPSASIFMEDYGRAPEVVRAIRRYARDVIPDSELPNSVDNLGCVSAVGAFILNRALGEDTTASAVDAAIGRSPNAYGSKPRLLLTMLQQGLFIEVHEPYNPLNDTLEQLARGEINFDEYVKIYEAQGGPIADEDIKAYRNYCEKELLPALRAGNKPFKQYEESGQMIVHEASTIDEALVTSLLRNNQYLYSEMSADASARSHAVSIFRPTTNMPALVFSPGVMEDGVSWSGVTAFGRETLERCKEAGVVAIRSSIL